MNDQAWFPLGLTDLISLQSKGLTGGFSSTTVRKLDCMVALFFNILRNLHCFPQWLHQFIFPPSVNKGFLFSTLLPAFISCLFDDSHPNRCEGIAHCGFLLVYFVLKSWDLSLPSLFLFYKIVLVIWDPLKFSINLRVEFSISAKTLLGFWLGLYWLYRSLWAVLTLNDVKSSMDMRLFICI